MRFRKWTDDERNYLTARCQMPGVLISDIAREMGRDNSSVWSMTRHLREKGYPIPKRAPDKEDQNADERQSAMRAFPGCLSHQEVRLCNLLVCHSPCQPTAREMAGWMRLKVANFLPMLPSMLERAVLEYAPSEKQYTNLRTMEVRDILALLEAWRHHTVPEQRYQLRFRGPYLEGYVYQAKLFKIAGHLKRFGRRGCLVGG